MSDKPTPDPAALLASGDELSLLMMRDYSRLCGAFAREPSQANALAADRKREEILQHFQQRQRSIDTAIDRLVSAALFAGQTFSTTGEWHEAQAVVREREAVLRAVIGLA